MRKPVRLLPLALLCALAGCRQRRAPAPPPPPPAPPVAVQPSRPPIPLRPAMAVLAPGETYAYERGTARQQTTEAARAAGLLDVDLSDGWAPFILQDGDEDPPKPNAYRDTFVGLANERLDADGQPPKPGDKVRNYLEVFGIPPSLSVLASRADEDAAPAREACFDAVDRDGLEAWSGELPYLDRDHAKRDYEQAVHDGAWMLKEAAARSPGLSSPPEAALTALHADPKARARVDRAVTGQSRVRAVRAVQARLVCEGLLSPRSKFTPGVFDLPTHEALARWERKNDIFGWGFLGGETQAALLAPTRAAIFDAFKRVLAERVADAAGIVEDGSINRALKKNPPTWRDEAGAEHPVPNLIDDHVQALLAAIGVATPEDAIAFLRANRAGFGTLHVAFKPPPRPAYYSDHMDLAAEIDRGDVWYDFPFDRRGKAVEQRRDHYPHFTLFVRWNGQKIPLCWWRTTIGSWRSEMHADGQSYFKYKNSDVGPKVWKQIVATPVWIPPDGTPMKDLLVRRVLDRNVGPVTLVNTEVLGPGYQSAYGLVMGIHIDPKSGFDNQIRTHGSVDYTSIARRFSHGCHRLVNNRAVRLFDFVLRHRPFKRIGSVPLNIKRQFKVDGETYRFALTTRGYYYELKEPVPVEVLEGRIMGQVKQPIVAFVRKPGVKYAPAPSVGDAETSTTASARPAETNPPEAAAPEATASDGAPELAP
ncbi:MAG TPA: L,D-transpeptidase [Polyangia bacterium]|nr:L,D-transpeptidase [Polyangia bacterium]